MAALTLGLTNLSLQLSARHKRRHGVNSHHVHRGRAVEEERGSRGKADRLVGAAHSHCSRHRPPRPGLPAASPMYRLHTRGMCSNAQKTNISQ